MTYRLVNKTIVVAGLIMAALIVMAHLQGASCCGWRILMGKDCALCGCTRDFFSVLRLEFEFCNPLSPFIFLLMLAEFAFRSVGSFALFSMRMVMVDLWIHSIVLVGFVGINFMVMFR